MFARQKIPLTVLASILGVSFSLYLAGNFGWHVPFIFLGLLSTLIFLLATFGIPPMRVEIGGLQVTCFPMQYLL